MCGILYAIGAFSESGYTRGVEGMHGLTGGMFNSIVGHRLKYLRRKSAEWVLFGCNFVYPLSYDVGSLRLVSVISVQR